MAWISSLAIFVGLDEDGSWHLLGTACNIPWNGIEINIDNFQVRAEIQDFSTTHTVEF